MSGPGKETGAAEQRRPSASEAELTADLKPRGALERMMIQQMARAHDTTLTCFDRAEAAPEAAAREVELRLAARFMALFLQQASTLERRRALARQAAAGDTVEDETAPAPPPGATAPLNRHQRRALAKRQRKARKRLAAAA